MIHPLELLKLATREGIIATKSLGQNFLIDDLTVDFILDQFSKDDVVLEIGPGLGVITLPLVEKVREVWSVEKDQRMVKFLNQVKTPSFISPLPRGRQSRGEARLKIIQGDYLRESTELKKHISKPYKIFGNIPYYITKPIVQDILFSPIETQPTEAILMIQKEVAERLIGKDGSEGILTIIAQLRARVELLAYVPKTAFRPQPKVDSALVKITLGEMYSKAKLLRERGIQEEDFIRIVKACFANRRKKLRNTLAAFLRSEPSQAEALLKQSGIDPDLRSENLKFEEWVKLADAIKSK